MAKTPDAPKPENNAGEIRGKLIKRLAVAGGLVASLLGMLAFFDYLATTPEEPEAPVFTRPVPVVPKKEVTQLVTPATDLPEPPSPLVVTPEPVVELPPAPVVEAQPYTRSESKILPHSENRPLTPSTAANGRVPESIVSLTKPAPVHRLRAVPEETAAPTPAFVEPPPLAPEAPARPTARVLEAKTTQAPSVPTPQRLFSGFLVQAGVFTNPQRAEELHAKLTLSGVPSTLETRVQVGPFRTRQEAEAAQIKLRELGIESVLVAPKGARR